MAQLTRSPLQGALLRSSAAFITLRAFASPLNGAREIEAIATQP